MGNPSWRQRFRYWFDRTMSRGPVGLIGWLAVLTLVIVLVMSGLVWLAGVNAQELFGEQVWLFSMMALDADAGGIEPWGFRAVRLLLLVTSIFVTSSIIGLLSAGIDHRLAELRRGRSQVLERGHTVLLGWTPQVFPIISELVTANENKKRASIVILGDEDKVKMEEEIREKVGNTKSTRVVCRSGTPLELSDLDIVSLNRSRAIIVLPPPDEHADATVIKTLLAITNNSQRRPEPFHIVAPIHDPKNLDAAHLAANREAELILTGNLIARLAAQTCRQSGLSVVYNDLLNFEGDEIYFKYEPSLVGKTFSEALLAYEESTVIGLHLDGRTPKLNPPMGTPIRETDALIAISQDDDTVRPSGLEEYPIQKELISSQSPIPPAPEHTLLLGGNWKAPTIVRELDNYVPPASLVTVVSSFDDSAAALEKLRLKNQSLTFQHADTTSRETLEALPLEDVHHIVILSYSDQLDDQVADARTLMTLLHLRDLMELKGYTYSIVTEMLDARNRDLAVVARADDFILSDQIVSLLLAQVAENKALGPVFADLFDPEGSEIYLKPASEYVALDKKVNYYTVVEAARRKGEVAIGYRNAFYAHDPRRTHGIRLNPPKTENTIFGQDCKVIVLAEA